RLAEHRDAGRRRTQPAEERADVEPGAADDHRHPPAALDVGGGGGGGGAEAGRVERLLGIDEVEAVVPDAGALGGARLRRPDLETAIDLPRVGGHDLAAERLGELEAKRRLAARGRADDADHPRPYPSPAHRLKSASTCPRSSVTATGRPCGQCAATSTRSIAARSARTSAGSSRSPTRTTLWQARVASAASAARSAAALAPSSASSRATARTTVPASRPRSRRG